MMRQHLRFYAIAVSVNRVASGGHATGSDANVRGRWRRTSFVVEPAVLVGVGRKRTLAEVRGGDGDVEGAYEGEVRLAAVGVAAEHELPGVRSERVDAVGVVLQADDRVGGRHAVESSDGIGTVDRGRAVSSSGGPGPNFRISPDAPRPRTRHHVINRQGHWSGAEGRGAHRAGPGPRDRGTRLGGLAPGAGDGAIFAPGDHTSPA